MPDAPTRWWVRLGLVLALALVHTGVWRPVRNVLIDHVALPFVESLDTHRSERMALGLEPRTLTADDGVEVHRYYAPAALGYLVVALLLVAAYPRRRCWLWLWLAHLVLGLVTFGTFVLGVGWTEAGFAVTDFGREYLAPALNLLALVAPVISARDGSSLRGVSEP